MNLSILSPASESPQSPIAPAQTVLPDVAYYLSLCTAKLNKENKNSILNTTSPWHMWLTAAQLGELVGELANIQRTPEIHSTAQGKKTPSGLERPGRTQRQLAPDVHTHLHTCISTYILTNMYTHIIAHTCIRAIIIMIIVRGTHLQPWIWCVCARLHKYNISMKAFYIYDGRLIKHRRRTLLTLSPPQDSGANLALNIHSWVQPNC